MRIILLAASLFACGGRSQPMPDIPTARSDTGLGPGDVFEVRVHGEEALTSDYRVAEDGTIDFPFVGRIEVLGLEAPDVSDRIATRLQAEEILTAPSVSVFVREYNSRKVSVIGAVARPGAIELTPGLTVVQAISLSGGFTPLANRNQTVLTRRITVEDVERFRVPIDRITDGRVRDLPMQAGDIVFVPERVF